MIIKKDLMKRTIAGQTILIPMGKTVLDARGLYALNELGSFLWDLLPEAGSEADLVSAVVDEYEVTPETARKDIAEFLDQLRQMEIIR